VTYESDSREGGQEEGGEKEESGGEERQKGGARTSRYELHSNRSSTGVD
jgi:hypothetical protein